ncbi:MAG: protein SCO1/2 [Alphaproteobacteria bacterium]|jgi:protein SCO1/2
MQNKWIGLLLFVVFCSGIYAALVITPPGHNANETESDVLSKKTKHLSWFPLPRKLSDFTISKHTGEAFTNADLQGKWTLAFVGYTFCPDICPVTLAEINKVYPALKATEVHSPLQVWFLSVDPKRDTVERLNEYINFFNSDFVAATGPHEQLFPLVRSMGMMYSMSESTDNPNYLVDHSASIVVINPDGNVVGRFKPKHVLGELSISDTEQIMTDMPILLSTR